MFLVILFVVSVAIFFGVAYHSNKNPFSKNPLIVPILILSGTIAFGSFLYIIVSGLLLNLGDFIRSL